MQSTKCVILFIIALCVFLSDGYKQKFLFLSFRNENQQFKRVVEKLERSPVCQRLPFRSFLVLPFQRITRIKLLVQVCVCVRVLLMAQTLLYCLTLCLLSLFNTLHSVSVQNIVKRTAHGTPEATQAIKSLKLLEKVQESPLFVCLFFFILTGDSNI